MDNKVEEWELTANRFVAFFDILGFKEMVQRNSHEVILSKLRSLNASLSLKSGRENNALMNLYNIESSQTQSVTFSDSFIIFSKGESFEDLFKVVFESDFVLQVAAHYQIPIKGAISFGKITVDFKNSLFFGQPIIDAYLLHEELQMIAVIIDHHAQAKIQTIKPDGQLASYIKEYKVSMRTGRILHNVVTPSGSVSIKHRIDDMERHYLTVSGAPRVYIDNTLEFLKSCLKGKGFLSNL